MEMEKKNVAIIILAIFLAVSGVGNIILGLMAGVITLEPEEKNVLTQVHTSEPYALEPMDCWDYYSGLVIDQAAETLFHYDYSDMGTNMTLIGKLATGYTISGAGLIYTITLQPGVTFHDGTKWNATVAKWNFDRLAFWCNYSKRLGRKKWNGTEYNITPPEGYDCPVAYPAYIYHFADGTTPIFNFTADWTGDDPVFTGCEIIDEYTIRFKLARAFADFPHLLTYEAGVQLSPTTTPFYDWIPLVGGKIVGTGPFVFDHYSPGKETRFHRNENYWRENAFFDEAVITYLAEDTAANLGMLAGDFDFLEGPMASMIPDFKAASDVVTYVDYSGITGNLGMGYYYFGLNNNLLNVTIREALNYAFNRTYVIVEIGKNTSVAAESPLPPGFPYYDDTVAPPQFNITHARTIMQSMNHGDTLDATYPGTNEAEWKALAAVGKFNYTQWVYAPATNYQLYYDLNQKTFELIGIALTSEVTYWGELVGNFKDDKDWLDIWPIGWGPDFLSPINMLAPLFHPESTATWTQFNDTKITGWLDAAMGETNTATLTTLYSDIQHRLMEEVFAHIPMAYAKLDYVHINKLVVPTYNPMMRIFYYSWYYK